MQKIIAIVFLALGVGIGALGSVSLREAGAQSSPGGPWRLGVTGKESAWRLNEVTGHMELCLLAIDIVPGNRQTGTDIKANPKCNVMPAPTN
jgi:hypothetical protein